MKNSVKITLVIMILSFISLVACQKMEIIEPQNNLQETNSIKLKNGMLSFPNLDIFNDVYNNLSKENNNYFQEIENKISTLKKEEINDYVASINFNKNKILEDFEKKYNFHSLRQKIENEMNEFNKINNPENIEIPENKYVGDKILQTLLNENCEVQIGNKVYKILGKGELTVEIQNENYNLANQINIDNFWNYINTKGVIIYGDYDEKGSTCKANVTKTKNFYNSNQTKRLVCKITVNNIIIIANRKFVTNVKAEEKNATGNWVESYTQYIKSCLYGEYSEGNKCSNVKKNLQYITQDIYGEYGEQRTERIIGRVYRVADRDVYLNVNTNGWVNTFNYYLDF